MPFAPLALSTRWNAGRHVAGEAMIDEILALGFPAVELGYDLRPELVPGVLAKVQAGEIRVQSVHNFCPVGALRPHPELYTPGSPDPAERAAAVKHIARTLRFAAEVGASAVVCHSGNLDMPRFTYDLLDLIRAGRQYSPEYERLKLRAQIVRDKKAPKQIDGLCDSLSALAPVLAETGVRLALENLPTWESIPSELEGERLMRQFASAGVRLWWDIGHAQIRDNLGFVNSRRWLERLLPHVAGFHVHDVVPPGDDHQAPPIRGSGGVNFPALAASVAGEKIRVLEPSPRVPADALAKSIPFLLKVWNFETQTPTQPQETP